MIRLLCAGLGGMGFADWSAAAKVKDFRLVAGADPDPAARQRFTEATGSPAFADFEEALAEAEAGAALIATPDAFHAPYSIKAMQAGLDVIVEKPMAETLQDARKMHAAAERLGRMLMVHNQLRWFPAYHHMRRLIAKGRIGAVRQVEFDMFVFSNVCRNGYRSRLPYLILQDLSIHHFDLMRFLTGAECVSMYARAWPPNEDGCDIAAASSAYAVAEMTGPVTVSYRAKIRELMDQTGYAPRVTVTGSRGVLRFADNGIVLQTHAGHARKRAAQAIEPKEPRLSVMAAFARAIRTREPALTWSGDNIKSLEMMFAAMKSARTGRIVRLAGD